MAKRKITPKTFVIDASVARRAGSEYAVFPDSIRCRNFLASVQKLAFCVATSTDIREEWKTHASRYSRKWLMQMTGRKRVVDIGNVKNDALRSKIRLTLPHRNSQKAMEKDCMILEAALATDKTVFSLDENVRHLFRNAAVTVNEIKPMPILQRTKCPRTEKPQELLAL